MHRRWIQMADMMNARGVARTGWAECPVLAKSSDLDPDFAEKFLEFVIREVIQHHKQAASR
jgi:hypothetical protein